MEKKSLKKGKKANDEMELWLQLAVNYNDLTAMKKERYGHASYLMKKIKAGSKTLH